MWDGGVLGRMEEQKWSVVAPNRMRVVRKLGWQRRLHIIEKVTYTEPTPAASQKTRRRHR